MKPKIKIALFLVIFLVTVFNITGCGRADEIAESDRALLKTQRENTILDSAFKSDYSDKEYKRLYEILGKITSYASDLYNYKVTLTIERRNAQDILICNQVLNDLNACRWIMLYASDIVSLFTQSTDQYNDFPHLKIMLEESVKELNRCIDDLNNIAPKLENIDANTTTLNLKDLVIEARDIIKKLKTALEERYKLVDEKRRKKQ